MDYGKAINYIVARRRDELAQASLFFRTLYNQNEQFRDVENEVRTKELDFAYGKIDKSELDKAYEKRNDVVKKLGVADKLYPKVHCTKCNDTGRVNDKICSCVKTLTFSSKSENVSFPLHLFSEIDLSLFNDEKAKNFYLDTAKHLSLIALKGDESKRKNINLIGLSGTGKTFLASCFASAVLSTGKSLVFITAFSFVDRALKYHTTFDENKGDYLSTLIEPDVLIIDDLGTENMFRNVTAEYLYHVINERQLKGRTTVITSNLSLDAIAVRYGERIASRLFDKKLSYTREFNFDDIRKIKL